MIFLDLKMLMSLIQIFKVLTVFVGIAAMLNTVSPLAQAQTLEKNPAKIKHGTQNTRLPQSTLKISKNDKAFGVPLKRLVVVNRRERSRVSHDGSNVDLSRTEKALQSPVLKADLEAFIGKPLSQKLVDEIRTVITQFYRKTKRPLVSVTTPPQEITQGILKVEVMPFLLADIKTEGNTWTSNSHIQNAIRVRRGEEINSQQLIDDANWLNLNPYRNLSLIFEPGDKVGTTNLILRSNEQKPWTVYAGINNAGTQESDRLRFYTGFNLANFTSLDHQLSYQYTTSGKTVENGDMFQLDNSESYFSHSLSYFAPLTYANGWRHKVQFQANYVENLQELFNPFTQASDTLTLYGDYAIPIYGLNSIALDIYFGVDFKRQNSDILFDGALANNRQIDILQGLIGVRGSVSTPFGFNADRSFGSGVAQFDLRFVNSPGDLTSRNRDANFVAIANNINASSNYTYLYGTVNHTMPLPDKFFIRNEIAFQIGDKELVGLEQFTIGGINSVRGYFTNEISGDRGVSFRNDLLLPYFSVPLEVLGRNLNIQPLLFTDIGIVHDLETHDSTTLVSAGAGLEIDLGKNIYAEVNYAHAFDDAIQTESGDHSFLGNLLIKY